MRQHLWPYLLTLLTACLYACDGMTLPENEEQLVVEGYIDDGGFPVVMVTTSMPVNTDSHSLDSLQDHLLRWAKVTVSDDEHEVILTGMVNNSYFPPFIYTTSRLRGQAGKCYKLTVEYKDFLATAETTIPPRPSLDSIVVRPSGIDSLCQIAACFTDNPDERNYYKAFVRMGRYGKQWLSCYLGIVSDEVFNGYTEMPINKGELATQRDEYTPYFNYNDTITIKFAQIDSVAYRFWNDYENHFSFNRNPLLRYSKSLQSNIKGGLGCWYGCGAVTHSLILSDYRR